MPHPVQAGCSLNQDLSRPRRPQFGQPQSRPRAMIWERLMGMGEMQSPKPKA